jgi:hypothetical protein
VERAFRGVPVVVGVGEDPHLHGRGHPR